MSRSGTLKDHSTSARIGSEFRKVIDFPDLATVSKTVPITSFHLLQEWEGYVILKGKEDFTVRLLDLTSDSTYEEEEAVIPFSEITDDERKCMRLGSIFRWVIGYERSASGTKQSNDRPGSSFAIFLLLPNEKLSARLTTRQRGHLDYGRIDSS